MSKVASGILVLFFLCVPVADAYAATSDAIDAQSVFVTEPLPIPEPEEVSEVSDAAVVLETEAAEVPQEQPVLEALPQEEVVVAADDGVVEDVVVEVGIEAEREDEAPHNEDNSSPDIVATTTDTETEEMGVSTTTEQESPRYETATTTENVSPEIATSTHEALELPVSPPAIDVTDATDALVASSVQAVLPGTSTQEVVSPGLHTTDADAFSFSKTECVPLGNGAFQCVRNEEGRDADTAESSDVFAKRDASGDREVYLNTGASPRAITQNDIDDNAPSLDTETGDVVWHAQIDDRSQIMHYDITTGATTKLTKEAYNSMQPASFGGDVVFQSWIGNDWEVVLIDTDDGREILTDNDTHDIAPSITHEFVMWQAFEEGAWVAKVYDRKTKEVQTVRGIEGGVVENPRMIMVFDNKKDNGDVETVGYDPASGEVVPLAVTPVRLPERIPAPEEEQEEKAMVGTTTSTRIESKTASSTGTGEDDEPEGAATSTLPAVEVVGSDRTTTPETAPEVVLDITLDATAHIPDVVIPPFNTALHEVASTTSE